MHSLTRLDVVVVVVAADKLVTRAALFTLAGAHLRLFGRQIDFLPPGGRKVDTLWNVMR